MATLPRPSRQRAVEYPTSDGKPMAETDVHRDDMLDLIETLRVHFAADPWVYVSGNLLLFYEEGNKRKHVSPDVFVVQGVRNEQRKNYLLWQEGHAPVLVIELTSSSTRSEDERKKKALYRDVLKVLEYFLFDPYEDYLKPSMQGYRLVGGAYEAIAPVEGRLPSAALGLHLERDGRQLRLYDPMRGRRLPTPAEAAAEARAAQRQAEARVEVVEDARRRAEAEVAAEADARRRAEAEVEKLRRELDSWKQNPRGSR